jgi:single-strand DNA-binding protein
MGKSFNKVFLIGNVGADPEVRSTTGGNRVATLTLATSRQWKDRSGVEQEKVQWHRLVCWNAERGQKLADLVEKYVHKGTASTSRARSSIASGRTRRGRPATRPRSP